MLDSPTDVEFWVRNVARHPAAFWLPTASGRTYPDFVAKLADGRLLVAIEKRAIGELWQAASAGRGMYAIIEKERDGLDVREQLVAAIG